jgi:hypothetical protein
MYFAEDKTNPRESADSRILNQNKSKSSPLLVCRIEGAVLLYRHFATVNSLSVILPQ